MIRSTRTDEGSHLSASVFETPLADKWPPIRRRQRHTSRLSHKLGMADFGCNTRIFLTYNDSFGTIILSSSSLTSFRNAGGSPSAGVFYC